MKKPLPIIVLFLCLSLFNCKPSLVKHTNKTTNKIDKNSVLVDQAEVVKRKDYYFKTKLLKAGNTNVLKAVFFVDTTMQMKSEIYMQNSVIIKHKTSGLIALMKRDTSKKQAPYAKVFEQIYYYKKEKEGLLLEREVQVSNFNDVEKAKEKLAQLDFVVRKTNAQDYLKTVKGYKKLFKQLKAKNNRNHN